MSKSATKETKKAGKEKSKEKTAKAPAAEAPKYGIADLAKIVGLKEASVRVKLREGKFKKEGKSYGWNSKSDMEAVAAKIKPAEKKKAA